MDSFHVNIEVATAQILVLKNRRTFQVTSKYYECHVGNRSRLTPARSHTGYGMGYGPLCKGGAGVRGFSRPA